MWLIEGANVQTDGGSGYDGLYLTSSECGPVDLDPFVLNLSLVGGVRFDGIKPVELVAQFHPFGPGGGAAVSVGMNWHWSPVGIRPHARNTDAYINW